MDTDTEKILIVEDERTIALMECKKLEAAGFGTEVVECGKAALQRIEKGGISLLLLDYQLPDITASEVVDDLGEKIHSIPVIIVTGHGDEQLAVKMLKSGVADYIIKDADLNFIKSLPKIVLNHIERFKTAARNRTLQKQLWKSEEMFRRTFEAIPDPSYIWERLPDGKIILVNCNRTAKEFSKVKAAGFKDYITKPININKFLQVIDNALKQ